MIGKALIRTYTQGDKDKVVSLLRMNTPKSFSLIEEKDLIYYLENEIEHYFVIEFDSRIVGCGGFNFSGDVNNGKISWDILDPNYQNKGLGSLLLKFRIEKLKEFKSLKRITVRTSQFAYKFYEKNGFELKEIIKDYWAIGFDLYNMNYLD